VGSEFALKPDAHRRGSFKSFPKRFSVLVANWIHRYHNQGLGAGRIPSPRASMNAIRKLYITNAIRTFYE